MAKPQIMKLATYLSENKISPSAFATSIGVEPSTITRILRGERRPGIDLMLKIKAATSGRVDVEDMAAAQGAAA